MVQFIESIINKIVNTERERERDKQYNNECNVIKLLPSLGVPNRQFWEDTKSSQWPKFPVPAVAELVAMDTKKASRTSKADWLY